MLEESVANMGFFIAIFWKKRDVGFWLCIL